MRSSQIIRCFTYKQYLCIQKRKRKMVNTRVYEELAKCSTAHQHILAWPVSKSTRPVRNRLAIGALSSQGGSLLETFISCAHRLGCVEVSCWIRSELFFFCGVQQKSHESRRCPEGKMRAMFVFIPPVCAHKVASNLTRYLPPSKRIDREQLACHETRITQQHCSRKAKVYTKPYRS